MRHLRIAGKALKLVGEPARQPYVCRACLAQASRQFSTSTPRLEDENLPWWRRMQTSFFGSKEGDRKEKQREEKRLRKLEEVSKRPRGELETKEGTFGKRYEIAEVVDPSTHSDYVQATSWDGLEIVGSEKWVRQRADQGEQYYGFMAKKQIHLSDREWQSLLHHVAVEALTLQRASRDVLQICSNRDGRYLRTVNVTIAPDGDKIVLRYLHEQDEQAVLDAIANSADEGEYTQMDQGGLANEVDRARVVSLYQYGEDPASWMAMSLRDVQLKLAIVKRVMQLTGKRISDPAISDANTMEDLYNMLKLKEKPKKLAQDDDLKDAGRQVPNVKVYNHRRTPVHKEKAIGRWKVIEDELILRDLPVFGSKWVDAKAVPKKNAYHR